MTPLVSFYVTTHNEGQYVRTILEQLVHHCRHTGDEIVVLDDNSDEQFTLDALEWLANQQEVLAGIVRHKFDGDFAAHKNYGHKHCSGKYIFQIDADETLAPELLVNLHDILNANDIDLYYIPRINIVNGLTQDDINRWGWRINEKGHVMRPDYQTRLYKNSPDIKWQGKVHERITGHKTLAQLPDEDEYCIIHIKDIDRQRKQNKLYETIER